MKYILDQSNAQCAYNFRGERGHHHEQNTGALNSIPPPSLNPSSQFLTSGSTGWSSKLMFTSLVLYRTFWGILSGLDCLSWVWRCREFFIACWRNERGYIIYHDFARIILQGYKTSVMGRVPTSQNYVEWKCVLSHPSSSFQGRNLLHFFPIPTNGVARWSHILLTPHLSLWPSSPIRKSVSNSDRDFT